MLKKILFVAGAVCILSLPVSARVPAVPASSQAVVTLPDFTVLAEKVGPTVVNIRTTERVRQQEMSGWSPIVPGDEFSELFRQFFGFPLTPHTPRSSHSPGSGSYVERNSGMGSGLILSSNGYVVTNAHVVNGADTIYVTLLDKHEFRAKLVGLDERTDIALLKITATHLPVAKTGDSEKVRVGEWVAAIGSPFGLDNTMTAGIVSAKGRNTGNEYLPFIQTDVAVNPGNSGGPLINMRAEVIGINSQIYSRTGGFMGISFAIPIDEVMRIARQLKVTGRVVRGRLGVIVASVTRDMASLLDLPRSSGAFVSGVEPNGPAERAGVQAGDIVLTFNGKAIEQAGHLSRLAGSTAPGTSVTLGIWRKGKNHTVQVVTGEWQGSSARAQADAASPGRTVVSNALGLVVRAIPSDELKALKLAGGVYIESVLGPAAQAGLQAGDIVLRIGDADTRNVTQFNSVVRNLKSGKRVAVLVRRGESTWFVPLIPQAHP